MSSLQGTENRALPIPQLSSLEKQLPNLVGMDTSLPTEKYLQRASEAEARGDVTEAERWYWVGIKVAASRDDRRYIQLYLEHLRDWAEAHNQTQRQLELTYEVVGIMENRGHEDDVASTLAGLACLQIQRGQPELAKLALDRALGNWRWKNNWVAMALAYSRLGSIYLERGDFAAALRSYQQARQLRESQPTWNPAFRSWSDPSDLANSLGDYAGFSAALGQYDQAEQYLREGIALLKKLLPTATRDQPSILGNKIQSFYLVIADTHRNAGDLLRSLEVVQEVERFAGATPSVFPGAFGQWGGATERRGLILLQQKDYAGAERAFRAEITRWEPEKVIGTGGVSRLKMELAQALSLQGKHAEALEKIGEVLRFVIASNIPSQRLHVLLEYVPIALRASDKKLALALLAEARQQVDSYGNLIEKITLLRLHVWTNFGFTLGFLGDFRITA